MLIAIQEKGGKIKPTHLLYKSNLSHKKMTEYLNELRKNKMIEEIEWKQGKMVAILDKGHQFVSEFKRIQEFSDTFGI